MKKVNSKNKQHKARWQCDVYYRIRVHLRVFLRLVSTAAILTVNGHSQLTDITIAYSFYIISENLSFSGLTLKVVSTFENNLEMKRCFYLKLKLSYDGPNGSLFVSILLHNSEFLTRK